MIEQMREACACLLADGKVNLIIGYGQIRQGRPPHPIFVSRPEDVVQLVWNSGCQTNLVSYLKRKDVKQAGKLAVVVKGCDERALVVLQKENQIDRSQLYVIGVTCREEDKSSQPKCAVCEAPAPRFADVVFGTPASTWKKPEDNKYQDLDELLKLSPEERMAYWRNEFSRCVKCYACRQVCPLCYCERCIVDKNRPQVFDTSASLKGNFAWHITRAFHLASRCVGCDECTRACPAGINLRLLNQSLARAVEENFAYRPGEDPNAEPVLGHFSKEDKENFIR